MSTLDLQQAVQIETFKILNNRRTPVWALLTMVFSFAYFNWHVNSKGILLYWLLPNVIIAAIRQFYFYPYLDKAVITGKNVKYYINLYTINVGITGVLWAIVLPYFFNPSDPLLLLVFVFCYFILLVAGTTALPVHFKTFLAYWLPLFSSMFITFLFVGEGKYMPFAIAFLLFNIYIWYLSNVSRNDLHELISLKFEKQSLAESIEEKKQLAEKSVEDKNRFLAAASHDLRQPLHTVNLLLSALNNQVNSQKGKDLLDGASNAMTALSNSFKSLLDVSKLDAGVVEVNVSNVPLHVLIDSLLLEFKSTAEHKNIELSSFAPSCYAYSDPTLLERILRNLISNAVKYTNKGAVSIVIKLVDESINVEIIDTGVGIPEDEQENIFSEYYQLDNPERDRNKGFGLGLAISKRLCDLLEIPLSIESKVGSGSTFSLVLQQGETIEPLSTPESASHNIANSNILVIDDDLSILYGMEKVLADWGCRALSADSEESALALLQKSTGKVDLILADYRLRNGKNGVDACLNLIQEFNLSIPSIIVTGDTSPERLKEVTQSGFRILHKPVKTKELKEAIANALSSHS